MQIVKLYAAYIVFFLLSALFLSGCAVIKQQNVKPNEVNLTQTNSGGNTAIIYTLTSPPENLLEMNNTQLIEVNFAGKQQRFIAQIEYSENKIALVGISTTGIPLFDVIWRSDAAIEFNQYVPLPELDIEFILADIQWTHWPIEQIESSIVGENISIAEIHFPVNIDKPAGLIEQRRLLQNQQVILEVSNFGQYFTLVHKLRNYTIKITPLNKDNK